MEFKLKQGDDFSLNDLIEEKQSGTSVVSSPHVGNQKVYSQVLAASGIDQLLVDTVKTGGSDYPEAKIINGEKHILVDAKGTISSRTLTKSGESLATIHSDETRKIFPEARIETDKEYFRKNDLLTKLAIEATIKTHPELFTNFVGENDSKPKKDPARALLLAKSGQTYPFAENPETAELALMPNETALVADFLIEAVLSEKNRIIHCGGSSMPKYIHGTIGTLNDIFGKIPKQEDIPDEIEVVMPDITSLSLATSEKNAQELNEIISLAESPSSRGEYSYLLNFIRENPDVLHSDKNPKHRTQYDITEQGLYIPKETLETPLKKLAFTKNLVSLALNSLK